MYYAYNQEGKDFGPYSEDEMRRLIADGRFPPDKLIKPITGGNWTSANKIFDDLSRETSPAQPAFVDQIETKGTSSDAMLFVCVRCHTTRTFDKPENGWMLWMGWTMILLGLWGPPLVFLWPPGLVLVIMAYRQRKPSCRSCHSRDLIPIDTPAGRELVRQQSATPTA